MEFCQSSKPLIQLSLDAVYEIQIQIQKIPKSNGFTDYVLWNIKSIIDIRHYLHIANKHIFYYLIFSQLYHNECISVKVKFKLSLLLISMHHCLKTFGASALDGGELHALAASPPKPNR
jgi:hypothetical protein